MLPARIGDSDDMFAISVCDAATQDCDWVGFLWVQDAGDTLHWFVDSDHAGLRISAKSGEVIAFDHLSSAPNSSDTFRYVRNDLL